MVAGEERDTSKVGELHRGDPASADSSVGNTMDASYLEELTDLLQSNHPATVYLP
jgi:hypothetical protein